MISIKERQKYLFGLTIWTWIISSIIGILFVFVLRHDLSGLEWFCSPIRNGSSHSFDDDFLSRF